ncbi:MAG: hypothetical protein M3220_01290 [Chloroflexota bacterium]|nr:hypothetical protein [Chloroflexota bacterium]
MKRLLFVILLLLLLPTTVLAEGPLSGGTRIYIDEEPLGPFMVSSFAAPNPPVTTDDLWVTVQVRDGAKAVTDARVWVTVTEGDGGETHRAEARHDLAAQPFDYTVYLPVPASGTYEVLIEMEHPDGGGTVQYPIRVSEPLTNYIVLVLAIPFLVFALWLARHFGLRLPTSERVLSGDEEPLTSKEALQE